MSQIMLETAPPAAALALEVKDCAIIVRMGGIESAYNVRELRERIAACPIECVFHHFCETPIRASFDYPEFRNDFAVWAAHAVRDRILAERLGVLNPYRFEGMEALRRRLLEILDERLGEMETIPMVAKGLEFHFMRGVTVVFDTGDRMASVKEFANLLPAMSTSSVYYHFVEARRRNPERVDDFSIWLGRLNPRPEALIQAFAGVDFYHLNLRELKERLVAEIRKEAAHAEIAEGL